MTKFNKRKILQIVPFGIIGLAFGILYAVIEFGLVGHLDHYPRTGNPYYPVWNSLSTILQALVMGALFGVTEVFVLDKFFTGKRFALKFLMKSIIYFVAIGVCLAGFSAISSAILDHEGLFSPVVVHRLELFFIDTSFWTIMLFIGMIFSLAILITEMSQHLGHGVFLDFLLGKYHIPREEERIFMFLDIKGSTTLAEVLGHVPYFKFLNQYYVDISKAIIETGGEIYQYVGDEVVITWSIRNKMIYDRCITCFFGIKAIIKSRAASYKKEYGYVPEFKAGLHVGKVTTGRIGMLKKEIVFTGDVLNTASRIQSICNQHHVDNLISEPLVRQLAKNSAYHFKAVGDIQLRGKAEPLKLYTV
jgi:adenylate cyclase